MLKTFSLFFTLVICQGCFLFPGSHLPPDIPVEEDPLPTFSSTPSSYPIERGLIDEASGIVASRTLPGNLWLIQDGNTSASLHLLSNTGIYQGKLDLPIFNRDWEDIAAGPGPEEGEKYIYIGEIGDNAAAHDSYTVYRLKEPNSVSEIVNAIDAIPFVYEDVPALDVEAMFVDPLTRDIYFISKRQLFSVRVYRLTYPYSTSETNSAEYLGNIPHSIITAADISSDGKQIIIKNLDAIFYWRREEGESIYDALSRTRDVGAPYFIEPQGESLCFDSNDLGYFTLSERPPEVNQVSLFRYYREEPD